ncbi:CRISPR-associated protein Cas4 [Campylobacter sp. RM16190]|uniref:CRISPR-associated protein Cas4 n=1 Tax=Campylobacter sp. RM16190 TaxID=1705727 RepID=UPI0014759E9A|nr:CRISPR-associated protein Cas4 [Campylobacter sp. RM16190]
MFDQDEVTGTLVNYYTTCKREAWLYAHHIYPDQEDENMALGRTIAEIKEQNLQDFAFSNLKFDKLSKERGHYLVTEYKKSLKNPEAGKMQLLFYLYLLKIGLRLKDVKGRLISGKSVFLVDASEENLNMIKEILIDIEKLVNMPTAPKFEYKKICDNCAYRNYCM